MGYKCSWWWRQTSAVPPCRMAGLGLMVVLLAVSTASMGPRHGSLHTLFPVCICLPQVYCP